MVLLDGSFGDPKCILQKSTDDTCEESKKNEAESKVDENIEPKQSTKCKSKSKKFACPYEGCSSAFTKNNRLRTHIRIKHTNYLPYSCTFPNCSASFACQTYLNKHLLRHEKVPKASKVKQSKKHCSICEDVSFPTKNHLRKHLAKAHPDTLPFQCDKCDLYFSNQSRLKAHQRRHRGYDCSFVDCDFHTDKWSLLRKHLATDHRKLECSVCMKTYSSHYNLRIHEQTVHRDLTSDENVIRFECLHDGCDKWYLRATSLKTHQRTVHCEPKHACTFVSEDGSFSCTKKFRHKKSLIQHQKTGHHNTEKKKVKRKLKPKLKSIPRFKPVVDEKQFDSTDQQLLDLCTDSNSPTKICIEDLIDSNLVTLTN